jgi:AraC family transcriptional regulator
MRLKRGQFLGVDLAGLRAKAFVVRVTRYAPGAELAMHDHRNPNLCLILHGGFRDLAVGWGQADIGAAVMHPAGMGHAQRFADGGSLAVNVELDPSWLRDVGGSDAAGLLQVSSNEALTTARRLWLALEAREPDKCIAATLARLLCGRGVDGARADNVAVRGIKRASLGMSVQDVSAGIGVDPSHYGREFSKRVGCSPSQMSRWERIARAVDLLRETDRPLADVAIQAGYCDQSHMCREMMKVMGCTPKSLRAEKENFLTEAQDSSKTR